MSVTCTVLLVSVLATAGPAEPLAQLRWLSGCWEGVRGERHSEEQWMAPRGGLMLGMSRTVVRDTTREYESVRIDVQDGRLVYTAQPSGQSLTSFTAITVTDTSIVFENLEHDFPQRVLYTRHGPDSLVARIEGLRGGQLRGIDFPMRRATCPGGP